MVNREYKIPLNGGIYICAVSQKLDEDLLFCNGKCYDLANGKLNGIGKMLIKSGGWRDRQILWLKIDVRYADCGKLRERIFVRNVMG